MTLGFTRHVAGGGAGAEWSLIGSFILKLAQILLNGKSEFQMEVFYFGEQERKK